MASGSAARHNTKSEPPLVLPQPESETVVRAEKRRGVAGETPTKRLLLFETARDHTMLKQIPTGALLPEALHMEALLTEAMQQVLLEVGTRSQVSRAARGQGVPTGQHRSIRRRARRSTGRAQTCPALD